MIVLTAIPKNVAWTSPLFPMIATANGQPLANAAASADSQISQDGGAFTECTYEIVELETDTGYYTLQLTQAEMNADKITIRITATNCITQTIILLTGAVPANVTQVGGNTQSATDLKDFADNGYDPAEHALAKKVRTETYTIDITTYVGEGYPATETLCNWESVDWVEVGDILVWPATLNNSVTVVTSVNAGTMQIGWSPALPIPPETGMTVNVFRGALAPLGYTPDRATKLDNLDDLDVAVSTRVASGADSQTLQDLAEATAELLEDIQNKTDTLPAPTTEDIATEVWTHTPRALS